ncbi:GYF domain [Dillenia turbinata]|uniref:GYF domain n=1 Tax=Dillenia turbinata TaxID=194707 RepID=A0AAN8V0I2_9MAGN
MEANSVVDGGVKEMSDSQLVPTPPPPPQPPASNGDGGGVQPSLMVPAMGRGEMSGVKRKRGRPPRNMAANSVTVVKRKREEEEEEDVCFICFDGGDLVLCDRKGCPKAYHPPCIKRDESFFRSKAKWNCGWHICSVCQKASHYMCYTCTYSLCRGCIKVAEIYCVRGEKGFCTTCMRTIKLIEKIEPDNNETVQVDFDDKGSWEYLFKVYWIFLKEKLSLSVNELIQAKNPWRGAGNVVCNGELSDKLHDANGGNNHSSNSSINHMETTISKRRKPRKQQKLPEKVMFFGTGKRLGGERQLLPGEIEWATKELLEFVAHMKNGDTSILSQFDVQALLLDYIKRNNLRDPRRKSQIICDTRLTKLFGKSRVGHFEMLKLLEYHFLVKEESQADNIIQGGVGNSVTFQFETDGKSDNSLMVGKDKRRKTRKKDNEARIQINPDEYAAIDVHNINLIYVWRNLLENLIDDSEKLPEKVVGSIVRIRVTCADQNQDVYRLVQVVGTKKTAIPYKTGNKTTDFMLEILNLDKTEVITIDAISNQEFSEVIIGMAPYWSSALADRKCCGGIWTNYYLCSSTFLDNTEECRRLRQSIKCGLVNSLTVGKILEKARALQSVKVYDWLEAEKLRLNHLRDRASEKGECIEKLQLLDTPQEQQRRLNEIPEVHADPKMNPSYESEEEVEKLDSTIKEFVGQKIPGFGRKVGDSVSSQSTGGGPKILAGSRVQGSLFHTGNDETASRTNGNLNQYPWNQHRDSSVSNLMETSKNPVDTPDSRNCIWYDQAAVTSGSFSGEASESLRASTSVGNATSTTECETEKLWYYKDPSGKIQGPFSMVQLRKWSENGFFPPDLRIWKITEKQDNAVLLTDTMLQQLCKSPPILKNHLQVQEIDVASKMKESSWLGGWDGSNNENWVASKEKSADCNIKCSEAIENSGNINKIMKLEESQSSSLTRPADTDSKDRQTVEPSLGWDSLGSNSNSSSQRPVDNLHPSLMSGNESVVPQENEGQLAESGNAGENHGNGNTLASTEGLMGQPTGENGATIALAENVSSQGHDSSSSLVSVTVSSDTPEKNSEIDFPDLHSPTPRPVIEDCTDQATENKGTLPSQIPGQSSSPVWSGASPTSHPASNTSGWQAVLEEADDSNFLGVEEESVSNLLKSLADAIDALDSPLSYDLPETSKPDCFSSMEGTSSTPPVSGKSDVLSSTGDLQIPSQTVVTDDVRGVSPVEVNDPQKWSGVHSSTSPEEDGKVRPNIVVNHWEGEKNVQPQMPSSSGLDITWSSPFDVKDTGWCSAPLNANLGWEAPAPDNLHISSPSNFASTGNANASWAASGRSSNTWQHQPKHIGGRYPSQPHRDRAFQSGSSGFGRDRPSWNRQSSFNGRGGNFSRPPPKGQRGCKVGQESTYNQVPNIQSRARRPSYRNLEGLGWVGPGWAIIGPYKNS